MLSDQRVTMRARARARGHPKFGGDWLVTWSPSHPVTAISKDIASGRDTIVWSLPRKRKNSPRPPHFNQILTHAQK